MRIVNKEGFANFIKGQKYKVAVEIGSGEGNYSKFLLENTDLEKLYCIDIWEEWNKDDDKKRDGNFHYVQTNGDERFSKIQEKLKPFGNRVEFIRKRSVIAADDFDNNSIDVCCIDGDLTTENFLNDLKAWFPKIKTDGLFFGFEYGEDIDTQMIKNTIKKGYRRIHKSNTKKVLDFFLECRGHELQLTTRGKKCWFFIKKMVLQKIDKERLDLEVCIHTHHYQHRLCWMLSSFVQQKGFPPNIIISISHSENDGDPTTRDVCDFFRKQGLNIKEIIMNDKEVRNRAIARNIQVKETTADWMLFTDSDMVYDPYFFDDIHKQIKGDFAFETRCIGADRISLDIPFCIKYFDNDDRKYPCVIPDVADLCAKWPVKWVTGKKTAPGNFQLANVQAIRMRGNVYTYRARDVWRATKADRHFRCNMGGRCPMNVKFQYHLNHDRQGPELQR